MSYIVQTASAHMPNSCKGRYGRVAVIEVNEGVKRVSMISDRAKGVKRIVETWEKQHIGKTSKSAFARAKLEADNLAKMLNSIDLGAPC